MFTSRGLVDGSTGVQALFLAPAVVAGVALLGAGASSAGPGERFYRRLAWHCLGRPWAIGGLDPVSGEIVAGQI